MSFLISFIVYCILQHLRSNGDLLQGDCRLLMQTSLMLDMRYWRRFRLKRWRQSASSCGLSHLYISSMRVKMSLFGQDRVTSDYIRVVLCRVVLSLVFLYINDQIQNQSPYIQIIIHRTHTHHHKLPFLTQQQHNAIRRSILINNFNTMEPETAQQNRANQYLTNLLQQHTQNQSILGILQSRQQLVQAKLKEGELQISPESDRKDQLSYLLKKKEINPFQSHYKGFFLNSDRQKNQQRYEVFKKIKEEYSKEKTAIVVKEVQKKIKEWTAKKLQLQKKKGRSQERQNKIQLQMIQHLRRQQIQRREAQEQMRKEQLKNRIKRLEEKRAQRQQFMKKSSVRSLDVRQKQPKYKEIEERFKQIEQRLQEQQQRLLQHKRQSMLVDKQEIEQHARKYEEIKKKKEEERKNKLNLKLNETELQNRESFNAFNNSLRQKKKEQAVKRKRMKEFQEKVKSVILIRKKSEGNENQEQKSLQKSKVIQPEKQDVDKQITSLEGKKVRKIKRKMVQNVDGRKLGNDYLKQLKQKDKELLNKTEKEPKLTSSASLPAIKPAYKNYLTEVKIKRRPVGDEIDQLKRNCQSQKQVYEILNKKSQAYEQSMMKKINSLKKINKYDQSVVRQSQIDDLYSRYIKVRLACIQN